MTINTEYFLFLGSNGEGPDHLFYGIKEELDTSDSNSSFDLLATFRKKHPFIAGYLSYDLKNELERLQSANPAFIDCPALHFFAPMAVLSRVEEKVTVLHQESAESVSQARKVLEKLCMDSSGSPCEVGSMEMISPERYMEQVQSLQVHIAKGDIYEANFCQEIRLSDVHLEPLSCYNALNAASKAPYSCLLRTKGLSLICASPELFLEKRGQQVTSKPIKGTRKRDSDPKKDHALALELANDMKERAENIMITDLVRNDLSRTALPKSVKVRELCKVYSYDTVHQMISTIVSKVSPETEPVDIIRHAFPMGSMTGAPKIRAMQLIDVHEDFKRGIYSGAVGFFGPEAEFTFNVVIRSILYDEINKRASISAGGAITAMSDPEKEYEESALKAHAMLRSLGIEPSEDTRSGV